jgi:4-diphosphocytidyl-2-C-methyl-D-erythritol kinase
MSATLRVFAPAKLNLHLHVGPPGPDGRHDLQSLALFADVGDWLEVAPASEGLSLTFGGPFGPTLAAEADNLVLRAAQALAQTLQRPANARLHLEKHLPIASGIGGGSADAAAALRGLARLWAPELPAAALERIGASLGADVPVCVPSRTAFMGGTGEQTTPVAAPAAHAVLINPGEPLSTGAVYRRFDEMGLGAAFVEEAPPAEVFDLRAFAAARRNDLEPPARALSPAVGRVLDWLERAPEAVLTRMSGSGATCFALVEHMGAARALAQRAAVEHPRWWTAATRLGAVEVEPEPAA